MTIQENTESVLAKPSLRCHEETVSFELMDAIENGDYWGSVAAIDDGANIHILEEFGYHAKSNAANYGYTDICELLEAAN